MSEHKTHVVAALILGIIGLATIWLDIFPGLVPIYFFMHMPMAFLAIVFGFDAYRRRTEQDSSSLVGGLGLAGVTLGVLTLVLGGLMVWISVYNFGWYYSFP